MLANQHFLIRGFLQYGVVFLAWSFGHDFYQLFRPNVDLSSPLETMLFKYFSPLVVSLALTFFLPKWFGATRE